MKFSDSCPACGYKAQQEFDLCPKCGIIIEKYFARHLERQKIESEKEKERITQVKQDKITETNTSIADKAKLRSYFFFLITGYLVSWVWYKFWDGLRSWGDGATIAPIGGKEFIYMILPLILCVGATILFLFQLKNTRHKPERNQRSDHHVEKKLSEETNPKLRGALDFNTKVIVGVAIPYFLFTLYHIVFLFYIANKPGDQAYGVLVLFYLSFVYIPVLVFINFLIIIPPWRHISLVKILGLIVPVAAAYAEYWFINQ